MLTAVPAVITTRSPSAHEPPARAASIDFAHRSSTSAPSAISERRHAPLDRHLPKRVLVVRERDDRPARAQTRDRGRRPAAEGRDEHRGTPERLRDVAGRVRHRLADRRLLARLRELVPVAEARLDGARDPVHVRDRLDRVLADRGLAGEHRPPSSRRGSRSRRRSPRPGSARARWIIDSSIWVAVITGFPRSSAAQDDPLLHQRHARAPISTPRSPRATMTASVSRRISSSASTASAFSIFAITWAGDPASSIRSCRSRTSAAERTNESATKSTPRSSAKSRSSMSLRVSDGIGSGHARDVHALVRRDDAADDDRAAARPRSTASTRSRMSPSSIRTS